MSKEFTYHQRPPDNRKEFERRYERIFGTKDTCPLCDDESDNHYWHTECCRNLAKTTEQKQHNE